MRFLNAFVKLCVPVFGSLSLFAAGSVEAKQPDFLVEIKAKDAIEIKPDKAYLLFRTDGVGGAPTLLRIPTSAELASYQTAKQAAFEKERPKLIDARDKQIAKQGPNDPAPPMPTLDNFNFVYDAIGNVQNVNLGRALVKDGKSRTMLVEAVPGDYVFYGIGFGPAQHTCMCLGTVSFAAKAGVITDLGTILTELAWRETDIPELKGHTNMGASVNGHVVTWAAAIRPVRAETSVPADLKGRSIIPAEYHAVGKFVSPLSFTINRLPAISGVIGYNKGDVLDLRTGKVAGNLY